MDPLRRADAALAEDLFDLTRALSAFAVLAGLLTCAACTGKAATGKSAMAALHSAAQPVLRRAGTTRRIQLPACIILMFLWLYSHAIGC
jgi:hypothetical protein